MDRFNTFTRTVRRRIGINRKRLGYASRRSSDEPIQLQLLELAAEHRRCGLPRVRCCYFG
jgi:hypothetical protein